MELKIGIPAKNRAIFSVGVFEFFLKYANSEIFIGRICLERIDLHSLVNILYNKNIGVRNKVIVSYISNYNKNTKSPKL